MTDEERQKLVADLREFTGLDNEPWLVRVGRDAANEIKRLAALAQSDAPWQCPIGIPPESHSICSAGTCWWCLADRVKAQSDTEPESYGDQLRRVMKRQAMQSDAEPVAWQTRAKGTKDWYCHHSKSKPALDPEFYEARPLYAAPPLALTHLRNSDEHRATLAKRVRHACVRLAGDGGGNHLNGFGTMNCGPISSAADRGWE